MPQAQRRGLNLNTTTGPYKLNRPMLLIHVQIDRPTVDPVTSLLSPSNGGNGGNPYTNFIGKVYDAGILAR